MFVVKVRGQAKSEAPYFLCAWKKPSSLLCPFVSYEEERFLTLDPGHNTIDSFSMSLMKGQNKLEHFSSKPCLMFVSKAKSLLKSGAREARELFVCDKHSSLLGTFVSYEEKSFITSHQGPML